MGVAFLALLAGGLESGCATPNPLIKVMRLPNGMLRVDGPAAGPFSGTEDLAAQACELMTRQPGASSGRLGKEYCALWYYSVEEKAYFLSYLSDFGREDANGVKACEVPLALNHVASGQGETRTIILGPGHNHPHNREFSPQDMARQRDEGWSPFGVSRFLDPGTNRIWERELFVFYREPDATCSSFKYNYATRGVYSLREGRWLLIGRAEGKWGTFKPIEGRGWQR
ncbi:hypothetical protein [Pyxidicoccus xibeiensis]|uniref:hypothetical protein n=1 Tax=Pyxidicoccus xibeiensis TaxID=2906759 RepID=UPI0020A6FBF0|nr:hypothetical protein [Pyxidicoccus xibeiensis]MCP3139992.1 hypothetical protein [Pyxidicoccus xibeiensis]